MHPGAGVKLELSSLGESRHRLLGDGAMRSLRLMAERPIDMLRQFTNL